MMGSQRIVFFDLETGGLDPARHPIIQFAGIAVDGSYREIEALEIKVDFDRSAAEHDALKLNSFSEEAWQGAAPLAFAVESIDRFMARHATLEVPKRHGNGTWQACRLAGHNAAAFDVHFLRAAFGERFFRGSYQVLDTLQLALWAQQAGALVARDLKLGTLTEVLGIPHGEAHDALGDVRATVAVARALLSRIEPRCPACGGEAPAQTPDGTCVRCMPEPGR